MLPPPPYRMRCITSKRDGSGVRRGDATPIGTKRRESKEILKDSPRSGYLLRDHDCTHVIFGLDISIDQEAILDTWVLWGTSFKWKYLLGYAKLPQIKDLQKRLMSELGIRGFLGLY